MTRALPARHCGHRPRRSLVPLAALLCLAAAPARALTGVEVIERMQRSFDKAKTFSVHFEKRFHWAVLDRNLVRHGQLYTRRPGQFRVEVEDGDLVVADGQAIWAYSAENEQVVVSSYAGELRTPWEILVEYADSFAPVAVEQTELGGRDCYLVTLQPRPGAAHSAAGNQVRRMRIWVDEDKWHLLQAEQLEANDDVRTYVLKGHRTNKKLDDELFRYEPPDGVEVIDRRPAAASP